MKIVWTPRARRQLIKIRSYIAHDNPYASDQVVIRILSATGRLELFPNIGYASDRTNIRLLQVTGLPYVLTYRVFDDGIDILSVFDQRCDPEGLI